jgi:hypothetical protein
MVPVSKAKVANPNTNLPFSGVEPLQNTKLLPPEQLSADADAADTTPTASTASRPSKSNLNRDIDQ